MDQDKTILEKISTNMETKTDSPEQSSPNIDKPKSGDRSEKITELADNNSATGNANPQQTMSSGDTAVTSEQISETKQDSNCVPGKSSDPPAAVSERTTSTNSENLQSEEPEPQKVMTIKDEQHEQQEQQLEQGFPPHLFESQPQHHFLMTPQLGYNSSGHTFPSLDNLVEFRYDLLSCTNIKDNRCIGQGDIIPCTTFNWSTTGQHIFVIVESVCHYLIQPVCIYICGEWVSSSIQIPVAQHFCIAFDDGVKRYEEVVKLDLLRASLPTEHHSGFVLTSVEHRVVRGNTTRRPRFRDILKRSLLNITRSLTDGTFEIIINRATGRCSAMDFMTNQFFTEGRGQGSYELHLGPLVSHIPQNLDIALSGIKTRLNGFFYRPVLQCATILLAKDDLQLFETLSVHVNPFERKIIGSAYDSALGRVVVNPEIGSTGVSLMEATSYGELGQNGFGLNVIQHNPRVPAGFHPFCNTQNNPVLSNTINPFYNQSFHPPSSLPIPPLLSFVPPIGYTYPYGGPMQLQPGVQVMMQNQFQPQIPLGMIPHLQIINPTQYPMQQFHQILPLPQQQQQQIPVDNKSESAGSCSEHEQGDGTPVSSPRQKQDSEGKVESTTKLNPNARDFIPQAYQQFHLPIGQPQPPQSGPDFINLNDLEDVPDEELVASSVLPFRPPSSAEMETMQLRCWPCVSNMHNMHILPQQIPVEQISTTEISMIVNRSNGGFINQSESHCSLYDPDTSLEIMATRLQSQENNNFPPFRQSWSEEVENQVFEDQAMENQNQQNQFCNESYNSNGRKYYKGSGRGGNRGGTDEWGHRNRFNGNYQWNGRNRQESGEMSDSHMQDLRLGHGFNNRVNFSGGRQSRGHYENERGYWSTPGRGRGGRGRGASYGHKYNQDRRNDFTGSPKQDNFLNDRGRKDVSVGDAAGPSAPRAGYSAYSQQESDPDLILRSKSAQTSESDGENSEKTRNTGSGIPIVSYAAAARTNVPEENLIPASQIFTPTRPTNESAEPNQHDQEDDVDEYGQYGDENNNITSQTYGRGFRGNFYNRNFRAGYRGGRDSRNDYNVPHGGQTRTQSDYSDAGHQNYQYTNGPKRDYYKYPRNSGDNWNTENTAGEQSYTPRGGRYQSNNRYQRNYQHGKFTRRGSGRTPHHQDMPWSSDFPPLYSTVTKPVKEKEPPKAKPEGHHVHKPAATATGPSRGGATTSTSNSNRRVKKPFKKFNKEGSGSSEDQDKMENYLADVIPDVEKVLPTVAESECPKDAQGDGLFQPDVNNEAVDEELQEKVLDGRSRESGTELETGEFQTQSEYKTDVIAGIKEDAGAGEPREVNN